MMSDEELVRFADSVGVVIPVGTKRSTIETRLVNAALVVKDGR